MGFTLNGFNSSPRMGQGFIRTEIYASYMSRIGPLTGQSAWRKSERTAGAAAQRATAGSTTAIVARSAGSLNTPAEVNTTQSTGFTFTTLG